MPGADEILDALPDAVAVVGPGGIVSWANRTAERLAGGPLVGGPLRLVDANNVTVELPVGRRLPMAKGSPEREYQLVRASGELTPVSIQSSYVRDARSVVLWAVCTMRSLRARVGMDLRAVELVSTVSHEIRAPLTTIQSGTQVILSYWDRTDDDQKRGLLRDVLTESERVTRLITELLDVSRLETGRLHLRPTRFDLAELAQRVVTKIAQRAKSHTIEVRFPKSFPKIFADADKVEQVLTNLVENAVKYTASGNIVVAGRRHGDMVEVAVSDEGDGIPAEQLASVFRKGFSRERAGSPSGTGLGLYISKGLIQAHGGEIAAQSVVGNGTTFTFRVPVQMVPR